MIDLFGPNCPLLPTTGPRSCSRCTAWAGSDSRWGLGPRCNCGSDFPCRINALCTGLMDVKSWPRLQPAGPFSVSCIWSHNLKCNKQQNSDKNLSMFFLYLLQQLNIYVKSRVLELSANYLKILVRAAIYKPITDWLRKQGETEVSKAVEVEILTWFIQLKSKVWLRCSWETKSY